MMKGPVATSVVLLLVVITVTSRQTDYCYNDISDPYIFFSTKTAYEYIHPNRLQPENIKHCEPVQLWFLGRHGTRYPSLGRISELKNLTRLRDQIIRNHESGLREGRLCNKDIDNLRTWTFNVTDEMENNLTPQGEEDLEFLARRLKNLYPSLLETPYKSDLYQFRFTKTQRTEASAHSFAKGLFGSSTGVYFPPALDNDTLIRPYESCDAWKVKVDQNPDTLKELNKFEEGPLMTNLIQNVSSRLGFRGTLKIKDIRHMYDMCRYDKAWKVVDKSPWCAVFSKDELKLLEYAEDLDYYYYDGYGQQMNTDLGCPLIKDLMDRFSQLEKENVVKGEQPVGVFYFSHSSMLHMMQCALGINKDSQPLRADNYYQMQKRMWKLSQIGPFAGNIEIVFFKCSEGDKNRVMFYQSERPMDMPDCKVGLCSWEVVKSKFQSVADGCNLNFCNLNSASGRRDVASWFSLLLLGALVALCARTLQ